MKQYLITIKTGRGACVSIAYYADTPGKNYRVYYNGQDTGVRYEKIGNASRHLKRVEMVWAINGVGEISREYGTKNDIPRRGSNA